MAQVVARSRNKADSTLQFQMRMQANKRQKAVLANAASTWCSAALESIHVKALVVLFSLFQILCQQVGDI